MYSVLPNFFYQIVLEPLSISVLAWMMSQYKINWCSINYPWLNADFSGSKSRINGNWYVWSGNKNGQANGGPAQVVAVWKYVVARFKAKYANNVKWVWTPNGPSIDRSEAEWNKVSNYWPGDEYVDWIGLDAYNFYPWDPWGSERRSEILTLVFDNFTMTVQYLVDQPMMIA